MAKGNIKKIIWQRTCASRWEHETSAPAFHLPDTLDWSCMSNQRKNQVFVVPPAKVGKSQTIGTPQKENFSSSNNKR